jgi:hypothetical protein
MNRRREPERGGISARVIVVTAALALICLQLASSQAPLALVGRIDLPGVEGRIDHLAIDMVAQHLYVAAVGNDSVEGLDVTNNIHLRPLSGFREP